MQNLRVVAVVGFMALAGACASSPKEKIAQGASFTFPVIGDIPYSESDREVFQADIVPAIKAGGYPFVIHLGDYKGGGAPCTPDEDEAQIALISELAPASVFYTPGDNEWTDCDRFDNPETGKPQSELARLDRLRRLFFSKPPELAGKAATREAAFPENVTWKFEGVRFATVHIVGTGNGRRAVMGDDPEIAAARADRREASAIDWFRVVAGMARTEKATALVFAIHADMTDVDPAVLGERCTGASASTEETCDAFVALRAAVRQAAQAFAGPTLLIHGDTAPFTLGRSFAGDDADNLWILNAAGDHGVNPQGIGYGVLDSTLVTFNPDAAAPFSAIGIATGQPPKQ